MTRDDALFRAECLCWVAAFLCLALELTLYDDLTLIPFLTILAVGILAGRTGDTLRALRKTDR